LADAAKGMVRSDDDATVPPTLGICPPSAVDRAAISNGSCGGNTRVEFGITVLLNRSLLGFSKGGKIGFAGATGFSFTAPLPFPLLK
jgi:hypothetical protein